MAEPEPKRWRDAALGGALVALGGAIFGLSRSARPATTPAPSRSKSAKAEAARQKAEPAAEPRTQYWPPPPPKPIAPGTESPSIEEQARKDQLPVDAKSEKLGFEVEDTKAGKVASVMMVSVAMIAGAIATLFYLIGYQHHVDTRSSPLTPQQRTVIVPPGPHLQDHPLHDIAMEKKRESDALTSYGWTGSSHQAARIPIFRAEALVIGKPLDPEPSPPTTSNPTTPAPNK